MFNNESIAQYTDVLDRPQSDYMSICLAGQDKPSSIYQAWPGGAAYTTKAACKAAGHNWVVNPNPTLTACHHALGPAEISYNCAAIASLIDHANSKFFVCFTYCGLVACEAWLWVRHGDGWLAAFARSWRGSAYAVVAPPAGGGYVHVRSHFEGALALVRREAATADAQRLTFALPHPRMLVPVPPGHHFLLRAQGAASTARAHEGGAKGGGGGGGGAAHSAVAAAAAGVVRPYTPVASEPGELSFVVKRVAGGAMSSFLLDEAALAVGATVGFDGPHGEFRYAPGTYARHGFVCGGSGVTPVLSVLRTALADPIDTTVFDVLVCNRTRAQMLCCGELAALAAAHPGRLGLHHALSREEVEEDAEAAGGKVHAGRATAALVAATMPPPGEHSAVACCGHPAFNFAARPDSA